MCTIVLLLVEAGEVVDVLLLDREEEDRRECSNENRDSDC